MSKTPTIVKLNGQTTLEELCKKVKCPHYKKDKPCGIVNCYLRDGEMDDNYRRY